jgi:hypothetical protein
VDIGEDLVDLFGGQCHVLCLAGGTAAVNDPYDRAMAPKEPARRPVEATVVIPTRNRWGLLSSASLPSALAQEAVEHEVIVVDEGSSDGTARELERLHHPSVRVIRHEAPRGVAAARNAGVAAARGEWVAFLDDDDLWAPGKLRRQIDAAVASGAGFAYCAAAWLDEDRRFLHGMRPPDPSGLGMRLLRWNEIWAGGSNVLVRTSVLRGVGGFDEALFQLADWDLWIRLALTAEAVAIPELLVGYVMQPQSMLLTDRRDVFVEFDYLVEKHAAASRRLGAAPDALKFTRWVARGHLRAGRRRAAAATYLRAARRHRDIATLLRAAAALAGEPGLAVARGVRKTARGKDPERLDVAEPKWLRHYR